MTNKKKTILDPVELRRRAEDKLKEKTSASTPSEEADVRKLLHEMQVHQIELELQNEELRAAQQELEATRDRYADLYDFAPVGYCTLDEKGIILEANLTAATLLGVERGKLIKQPITRFILKADQNMYYHHRQQLFDTGEPQSCELRMLKQDGTEFWGNLSGSISLDADESPVYRISINDITERKRIDQQIHYLKKAESLKRMAGAIAHRYNNLMTAVMGNLELTLDNLSKDSNLREQLTEAMGAARSASDLGGTMLAYLGQTVALRLPLDLCDICHQELPSVKTALPENVALKTDLPTIGPSIMANSSQIRQILHNLIVNAWESLEGQPGEIFLVVKTVRPTDIPVINRLPIDFLIEDADYACLEIADTGCGIPEKVYENIFDPFFTTKFAGRGLGLAVALSAIRVHGGCITSTSTEKRGSVFRVFLPMTIEPVLRPEEDSLRKATALSDGGTVLFIDDQPAARRIGSIMLKRLGFKAIEAEDGIQAIELFRECQDEIRCVLSDLTMPRMNGWETLEALRRIAPNIPVILTSGYDQTHVLKGMHPEMPQAFLHKPYLAADLKIALVKALSLNNLPEK